MAKRHWTDEELIGRLYGLVEDDSHLHECQECMERWRKVAAVRAVVLEAPAVSAGCLASQRREIFRRIEEPAHSAPSFGWAPVAASVALLFLVSLLFGPKPKPEPSLAVSDTQFFSEVYSVAQSTEPMAFAPVRELFEGE